MTGQNVIVLGLVCAWCGKTLREGSGPLSHGICPSCADITAAEADTLAVVEALEDGYESMAESLYRLRALWIGGMALPWGVLTQGQREGYIAEVKALVTKAKGEQ